MGKGDCMMTTEKAVNELKDKTSSTMTLGNTGSRVILIQPESNSSLNVDPQQRQGTNHNAQRKDQKQWMRRMLGIVIFLASVSSMILGFIALVAYFNLLPFSGRLFISDWSRSAHGNSTHLPFYVTELGSLQKCASGCVHRRLDPRGYNVIHDTASRWSAIVDKDKGRCLMFGPMSSRVAKCPSRYPWILDKYMGLLPCRIPLLKNKVYVHRVIRLINPTPLDSINSTGKLISHKCGAMTSYRVIAVIISYRGMMHSRVSRAAKNLTVDFAREGGKDVSYPADVYVFNGDQLAVKKDEAVSEEVVDFRDSQTADLQVYRRLSQIVKREMVSGN